MNVFFWDKILELKLITKQCIKDKTHTQGINRFNSAASRNGLFLVPVRLIALDRGRHHSNVGNLMN